MPKAATHTVTGEIVAIQRSNDTDESTVHFVTILVDTAHLPAPVTEIATVQGAN